MTPNWNDLAEALILWAFNSLMTTIVLAGWLAGG